MILNKIKSILFPPVKKEYDKEGNAIFIIDDPYYELEAVISELKSGICDNATIITLERLQEKFLEVSKLLEVDRSKEVNESGYMIIK